VNNRSTTHPKPWHKGSIFGDGPRVPLDRERKARARFLIREHRRAKRITGDWVLVGEYLVSAVGKDGRCDPAKATIAEATGCDERTVTRALDALRILGVLSWVRRIVRAGWRSVQTSNAYWFVLAEPAPFVKHIKNLGNDFSAKESAGAPMPHDPAATQAIAAVADRLTARFNAAWEARKGRPAHDSRAAPRSTPTR
jgi:hypothetical protein